MYNFHYKYIKNKLDAKLLFTDTDSLVYEIKTEDVYEDFYQDKSLFDFDDDPLDSKLFDPANKKVTGTFLSNKTSTYYVCLIFYSPFLLL